MNKIQIQHLLSQQKVNSISDIICFVIQQLNKTLAQQPLHEIFLRVSHLEQAKGLDLVMIQEVKTICEALIDQREESLRNDFDKSLNDHWQHIERALNDNPQNFKTNRQSLAQLDILNFLNTNSFNSNNFQEDFKRTWFQDQLRRNRDSFKEFSKEMARDNLTSDCDRLRQSIHSERKQVNDLKYSLMEINRQISNKITIEQAHTIITQFQSRMYHKIQSEKLEFQKLEFNLKKEMQQEILKVRKQSCADFDLESLKKQLLNIKKFCEKVDKKLQKYRDQTKSVNKAVKNLDDCLKTTQNEIYQQKKLLDEYRELNSLKNQDLSIILDELNKKLSYFEKIDQLQAEINNFSCQFAKAHWLTQCKTKNESIVWEKQLSNTSPHLFKFEPHKSQILVQEPGTYSIEFYLFENKLGPLSGSLWVQSLGLESIRKQIKATGNQSLKFIFEVQDKSTIWLKLFGGQTNTGFTGKGTLRISKEALFEVIISFVEYLFDQKSKLMDIELKENKQNNITNELQ